MSSRLLAMLSIAVGAASATQVFVMLPLDTVTNYGSLKDKAGLGQMLDEVKQAGVDGFSTDCWWGLTEAQPKQYKFDAWNELVSMAKQRGLKVQITASFHVCGGLPGDACNIPLPAFVASQPDIWFKDVNGSEDHGCISFFADNVSIQGRTPLEMYGDWLSALEAEFSSDLGSTVVQVRVGMGPAGELRYPSYQTSKWSYCGIGAFQAFDVNALASFKAAAVAANHSNWTSPPTDAGGYDSRPSDTFFFESGYTSEYGSFFLNWYSKELQRHGGQVLDAARAALGQSVAITGKVAGVHWWYNSSSHAAELTAGYYNTVGVNCYDELAQVFKQRGAHLDFACMEMRDSEQQAKCSSEPEELVTQVAIAAVAHGVGLNGENALPRFDETAFEKVESYKDHLGTFTYLRLGPELLNGTNFHTFTSFVSRMHATPLRHWRGTWATPAAKVNALLV